MQASPLVNLPARYLLQTVLFGLISATLTRLWRLLLGFLLGNCSCGRNTSNRIGCNVVTFYVNANVLFKKIVKELVSLATVTMVPVNVAIDFSLDIGRLLKLFKEDSQIEQSRRSLMATSRRMVAAKRRMATEFLSRLV